MFILPAQGVGLKIGPRKTHAEQELFPHVNRYNKVCVKLRESLMLTPNRKPLAFLFRCLVESAVM